MTDSIIAFKTGVRHEPDEIDYSAETFGADLDDAVDLDESHPAEGDISN
jgi:hypothetical protein